MKVYCGVPGSGKTTLINERHPGAIVCSADHHFVGDNGVYRFDPSQLPEAHGACLRKFAAHAAVGNPEAVLVVDNTNTTVAEVAPYAAFALAYRHELTIVTVECDPKIAAARNTHGVPEAAVVRMAAALAARQLPPWWKHEVVKPLAIGERVIAKHDSKFDREYVESERIARGLCDGMNGRIVAQHDSHGECFTVEFENTWRAAFEFCELERVA